MLQLGITNWQLTKWPIRMEGVTYYVAEPIP